MSDFIGRLAVELCGAETGETRVFACRVWQAVLRAGPDRVTAEVMHPGWPTRLAPQDADGLPTESAPRQVCHRSSTVTPHPVTAR